MGCRFPIRSTEPSKPKRRTMTSNEGYEEIRACSQAWSGTRSKPIVRLLKLLVGAFATLATMALFFLLDSRHCDDGAPNGGICAAHNKLPKWMRSCVRNLVMSRPPNSPVNGNLPVYGGYDGLSVELSQFFASAKTFSGAKIEKAKQDFAKRQASEVQAPRPFDSKTGART